ncbi:MAG TPA: TolC family protein [Anaeromyxobacteraceae bacterium]|nr:TolC family protein [Anaeromyxobacteraceae bacterium]
MAGDPGRVRPWKPERGRLLDGLRRVHLSCVVALALTSAPVAAENPRADSPVLTMDEAVEVAQRGNHLLASTAREVAEADEHAAALRTRRLPALRLDVLGGRLLKSLDFTIPAGSLGRLPPIGALPPMDSTVSVPDDFALVAVASATQPLTQQYRIGLGLMEVRLDRQVAEEGVRRERQRLATEVRTTYYQISATEAGVAALRDLVRAVEEVDAVTARYLVEGLALRSDALEVKARLARERQRLAASESGLATQHEHLNQLMGRDVAAPFRVARPEDLVPRVAGLTLETARQRARAARPEIGAAALRVSQAATARRLAHAEWIPDLSLTASYVRLVNFRVLPEQVAVVGLYFSWEPFDWGRRSHEAAARAHQIEQARDGREETEQQVAVEVGLRWRALKDAAALLEAARLDAEACAASLETDRNRYREDAAILRDVLRTEARLSAARHDSTDALAGYWSAAAELERAIGDEN